MPGERGGNLLFPVIPVMAAGKLVVLVSDAKPLQLGMKRAVLVEEMIFKAAIEAQGGKRLAGLCALGQGEEIVIGAGRIGAEDEIPIDFRHRAGGTEHAAAVAVDAGESVGKGEADAESAVTAHRLPADGAGVAG